MNENIDIKSFLDEKVEKYNQPSFIETDPIQIPRLFSQKENIEIAGFLAATIAWGQRKTIIKNARLLMNLVDNSPYQFINDASENDLKILKNFKHRTFNGDDCMYFFKSLQNIYKNHGGLENVFTKGYQSGHSIKAALAYFRNVFFETDGLNRTGKHVSNVMTGSAAKRLNMFLRWMVRKDDKGVDFGIWNDIPQSDLMIPLDVHTGNVTRKLGLLHRNQNDWKSVTKITSQLKIFDNSDPVKYDFALFGLGAFENF